MTDLKENTTQDTIDEIRLNADKMEKTLSAMRQEVLSLRDQLNVMKGEMNVMKLYRDNRFGEDEDGRPY